MADTKIIDTAIVRVTAKQTGDALELVFDGKIDDEFHHEVVIKAVAALPGTQAELNLEGVKYVNSIGIREFIQLIEKLQAARTCSYSTLSEPVVQAANFVPNFLGKKGTVAKNFQAPYCCPKCRAAASLRLTVAEAKKPGFEVPEPKCTKCGATLEFDEHPDEYFKFLERVIGA